MSVVVTLSGLVAIKGSDKTCLCWEFRKPCFQRQPKYSTHFDFFKEKSRNICIFALKKDKKDLYLLDCYEVLWQKNYFLSRNLVANIDDKFAMLDTASKYGY